MKKYIIDFFGVATRRQAHELIADILGFPEYYGRNLDALFDCLMELPECHIVLETISALGERSEAFVQTFIDAQQERADGFEVEVI